MKHLSLGAWLIWASSHETNLFWVCWYSQSFCSPGLRDWLAAAAANTQKWWGQMKHPGESQRLSCHSCAQGNFYFNFSIQHLLCIHTHDISSWQFTVRNLETFPRNLKPHLWNNFIFVLIKAITENSKNEGPRCVKITISSWEEKHANSFILHPNAGRKLFPIYFPTVSRVITLNHIC